MICKVCKGDIINRKEIQQKKKKYCSKTCADIYTKQYQTFYWHSHGKWVKRNYK